MNFKQLAFAAAVMATPFMAQAGMTAMDDSALSGVTGQDGISISGNFAGSVGAVVYTDGDASGGSLPWKPSASRASPFWTAPR